MGAAIMAAPGKEKDMAEKLGLAWALCAMLALAACHTTAGFGEDLSQGGHALTNSADQHAPNNPSP
jgi:entericidin B